MREDTQVIVPAKLSDLPKARMLLSGQPTEAAAKAWAQQYDALVVYYWPITKSAYMPIDDNGLTVTIYGGGK